MLIERVDTGRKNDMKIGDREQTIWWVARHHTEITLNSGDGDHWEMSLGEAVQLRDRLDEMIDHASREAAQPRGFAR
jgi:hypothetical protein